MALLVDAHRFQRLKVLYCVATELRPEEIPEFIEAACPDDAELRHALDRLLREKGAGDAIEDLGGTIRRLLERPQKR